MPFPAAGVDVTSPYDIEEIFPEDVRLPRRQSGSPQGLAVTLLADYTLRARAWLPSAAIVVLLGEAGVSHAGARATISRLARRGVLEGARQGRASSYRLTEAAAAVLSAGGRVLFAPAPDVGWDEWWTLIAFSLPQGDVVGRRELRGKLRWLGCAPLYDGLWISPHDLTEEAGAQLAGLASGAVTVFRARHVELGESIGRDPVEAWDTAAIAELYDSFIRRWGSLRERVRRGRITGAEAVRTRTEVMDTYRRLPVVDPGLPRPLLPADWPREPARELFAAIYDGLAGPAEDHVRAVAGPLPGVRAHTVADLVAGVWP
jgi:phenylacetic acid degradation operon negative regulatory protein